MITHDSVLLAGEAASGSGGLAFDLGTGEGEVARLVAEVNGAYLWIGLDTCHSSLGRSRDAVLPVLAEVERVPSLFHSGIADLVTANPPYFTRGTGRPSPDPRREASRRGDPLLLYSFVFAAAHLLKPDGVFVLTFRKGMEGEALTAVTASGMKLRGMRFQGRTGLLSALGRPA